MYSIYHFNISLSNYNKQVTHLNININTANRE